MLVVVLLKLDYNHYLVEAPPPPSAGHEMHGGGGGGGYFQRDEDLDTRTIGSAYDRYLQSVVTFLLLFLAFFLFFPLLILSLSVLKSKQVLCHWEIQVLVMVLPWMSL